MRILFLHFSIFFISFSLLGQIKKIEKRLIYPIVSFDYLQNWNRLDETYHVSEQSTFSFTCCRLIGIETDPYYKMNFYIFKDRNDIDIVLFEYNFINVDRSSDMLAINDTIHQLAFRGNSSTLYDLQAYKPRYYANENSNELVPNQIFSQFITFSNRNIPYLLLLTNLEKTNDSICQINALQEEKDKSTHSLLTSDWVKNKDEKLQLFKLYKSPYHLISIEETFDSSYFLYTFCKRSALINTRRPDYSKRVRKYIYAFGKPLNDNNDFDVISNINHQYRLKLNSLKLNKESDLFKYSKQFDMDFKSIYYQLKSGRIIGGKKYRRQLYYLRGIKEI